MSTTTVNIPVEAPVNLPLVDEPLTQAEQDTLLVMAALNNPTKKVRGRARTTQNESRAWSLGGYVD